MVALLLKVSAYNTGSAFTQHYYVCRLYCKERWINRLFKQSNAIIIWKLLSFPLVILIDLTRHKDNHYANLLLCIRIRSFPWCQMRIKATPRCSFSTILSIWQLNPCGSCRTVALWKYFVDSPVCQQKFFRRATVLQLPMQVNYLSDTSFFRHYTLNM